MNAPLCSNWARLPKTINQTVIGKQHVNFLEQSTTLEKTLEEIQIDISTQVLETKYVINLGQILKIVPNIKQYFFNQLKLLNWCDLNWFRLNQYV